MHFRCCFLLCTLIACTNSVTDDLIAPHHNDAQPIRGGILIAATEFPAVGAVLDKDNNHHCTGTLIGDNLVITANHCVDPNITSNPPKYFLLGAVNATTPSTNAAYGEVNGTTIVPSTPGTSARRFRVIAAGGSSTYDIAFLDLAQEPAKFIQGIVPVPVLAPALLDMNNGKEPKSPW